MYLIENDIEKEEKLKMIRHEMRRKEKRNTISFYLFHIIILFSVEKELRLEAIIVINRQKEISIKFVLFFFISQLSIDSVNK